MKTRKIMELNDLGHHIEVIKEDGQTNPYRIIRVWYDMGWHRKTLEKYCCLDSVLYYIHEYFKNVPGMIH